MEADAADEAGQLALLGRMTDQAGRLVDDQQAGVFVDDGEQVFQTREILTAKHTEDTQEAPPARTGLDRKERSERKRKSI